MTIEERAENAVGFKHNGCNCSQAVTAACEDLVDVDPATLMKMTSGFAVGMGCMEATCGSLIGAVIIAGIMKEGKGTVPYARTMLQEFQHKCGSTVCKELKGRDTGKVICECDDCVRNAVRVLGQTMNLS